MEVQTTSRLKQPSQSADMAPELTSNDFDKANELKKFENRFIR